MFICVSLNPAIDKRLVVDRLTPGKVHRVRSAQANPGGKSAHVAMVLRALGEEPHWMGPCGGNSGHELMEGLRSLGIHVHPFVTNKTTRTNLEILDDSGAATELLEPGEALSSGEVDGIANHCASVFETANRKGIVIFSGSLPPGVPPDFYQRLIQLAHSFGCRAMLDTSGDPLRHGLSARPFFVKPNREEAERLLGREIDSHDDMADALHRLLAMGAQSAALSLGLDGMLYCERQGGPVYYAPALSLKVRSAVGCGDAALAGFARSFASDSSGEEAVRLAVACAAANCIAKSAGAVRFSDVQRFQNEVQVQQF